MAIRKTASKLADGRDFFYFDDSEPYVSGAATRRLDDPRPLPNRFEPVDGKPVTGPIMRRDPLTGEWIPLAAHRMNRTFLPPADSNPLGPARPGAEYQDGEIPDTDYDVVVFENRFPSLMELPETAGQSPELTAVDGEHIFAQAPANGRCEVVCFGPDVNTNLVSMGPRRMRTVIEAWADRTAEIAKIPQIKQIFVFENHGEEIGVTLHHPHGQIYAYPFITPRTNAMLRQAALLNLEGVKAVSGLDGWEFNKGHEDGCGGQGCGCGGHEGGCCGSRASAGEASDASAGAVATAVSGKAMSIATGKAMPDSDLPELSLVNSTAGGCGCGAQSSGCGCGAGHESGNGCGCGCDGGDWDGSLEPLNLIEHVRDAELRAGTRVIGENTEWVWYVPVAAKWPLEYHLVPKRMVPDFATLDEAQKEALADIYLRMMIVANHFHRQPDGEYVDVNYISAWHQAPCSPEDGREILGLFNQFYSFLRAPGKMKYLAGSESGEGTWINDTTPEKIAARTREAAREAEERGAFAGLEVPIIWK